MVDKKDSELWAYGSRCYAQLKAIDDKKDSKSWVQGFRCYEHLKAMVDMNDFRSGAQGSWFYEQLRITLTWTTLLPKLRALDVVNYSGL